MTDGPERIWATVAGIQPPDRAHGIWDQSERKGRENWVGYIRADLADRQTQEAVAAKLERCAKVADTYQDWCKNWGMDKNAKAAEAAAEEIAAAIREGK